MDHWEPEELVEYGQPPVIPNGTEFEEEDAKSNQ